MVKKFQSIFRNRIGWRSLSKAAVLSGLFWVGGIFGFPWWAVAGIFFFALAFYFSLPEDRSLFRASFFLLIVSAFLISAADFGFSRVFTALFFGVLFFIMFGLVSFLFRERFLVYGIGITAVNFLVAAEIFYLGNFNPLVWLAGFLIFFILQSESFNFFGISWFSRRVLSAGAISLAALYVGWFISFLPLGFLNAAAFLALLLLIARDVVLFHFQGILNRAFVLKEITIFIILGILIFTAGKWSI